MNVGITNFRINGIISYNLISIFIVVRQKSEELAIESVSRVGFYWGIKPKH